MKGKIYCLVCNTTKLKYIGSTKNTLTKRLSYHKLSSNQCTSKKIIEGGNYEILLIEEVECENRDQLKQRERYWIENIECVNKKTPGKTYKEWVEDNREHVQEERKKRYEREKEQDAVKVQCECGATVNHRHIKEHLQTESHRFSLLSKGEKQKIREEQQQHKKEYKAQWFQDHYDASYYHVFQRMFETEDEKQERLGASKERKKDADRKYRETHKEHMKELSQNHYEKHKQEYLERAKKQREKIRNDPELLQKQREYKTQKAREYRAKKKQEKHDAKH